MYWQLRHDSDASDTGKVISLRGHKPQTMTSSALTRLVGPGGRAPLFVTERPTPQDDRRDED